MESRELKFLVLGAGAIGGIAAALMKRKGYDVAVMCRSREQASQISCSGLKISGVCGEFTQKIDAYSSASEITGKMDVILHATKATDMIDALRKVLPVLDPDGHIVSLQNGICEDELEAAAEGRKVIGCVTGWGATMEKGGALTMTSEGDFILGYPDGKSDDRLLLVAEALSSVVPVKATGNIMGHLYSKLIINSCITSLGAVCGLYLGEMLRSAKIRRIFIEIINEAVMVADKMNLKIEVFGGKLDFRKFIGGKGDLASLKRHLMIRIIGFKYRRLKSSSLQSLERGRPTEIDYLNGYIVRNGVKYNVNVPVNSAITGMIHEIELGKRKITPDNFNDPVFDRFNR